MAGEDIAAAEGAGNHPDRPGSPVEEDSTTLLTIKETSEGIPICICV